MVTKKKKTTAEKRGKTKVSDLKLNKDTVKDLTDSEAAKIVGGRGLTALACGNQTTLAAGCSPSQTGLCAKLK